MVYRVDKGYTNCAFCGDHPFEAKEVPKEDPASEWAAKRCSCGKTTYPSLEDFWEFTMPMECPRCIGVVLNTPEELEQHMRVNSHIENCCIALSGLMKEIADEKGGEVIRSGNTFTIAIHSA